MGAGLPLIVGVVAIVIGATGIGTPSGGSVQPRESPESAARALLTAWQHADRNAARKIADPGAVEKLFGATELRVNSAQMTCYPVGTGQSDCQVPHAKGILNLRLIGER